MELLKKISDFEEINNISISVLIHSDGSGTVKEFWSEEEFKSFDSTEDLNRFLIEGRLKKSEKGRSVSPIVILSE